ncbi:hypothetical protein F4777DRAFT_571745 [Nemania sp. FL0916]|nr:hypothetical protein F4777DRAFT_571745 [Nemania sp. FL0916]
MPGIQPQRFLCWQIAFQAAVTSLILQFAGSCITHGCAGEVDNTMPRLTNTACNPCRQVSSYACSTPPEYYLSYTTDTLFRARPLRQQNRQRLERKPSSCFTKPGQMHVAHIVSHWIAS